MWTALPVFALGAAGLTVDSLSPDALCPPLEETRTVVAARLGSVELEGTWHATYVLVHRKQGDFVTLSLRDPQGVLRLERDLPVQGGACSSLSRVIALVLERYFLRPEQAAPDEAPVVPVTTPSAPASEANGSALATPAPMSAVVKDAVTVAPAPKPQDAATAAPPQPPANRLSAGLWASTEWTAPSLGFARRLTGPYRLSLTAGFDLDDHETHAFEGTLTLRRVPLALGCEREFRLSPSIDAHAALEALGVLEEAKIAGPGGGFRVVPGLGARLGSHFFTQGPVQPFAELTAAWLLREAAPAFQVGGSEVLRPSALVFGLALGIATPF